MAFILRKPSSPCQIANLNLSGPRGALQTDRYSGPYDTLPGVWHRTNICGRPVDAKNNALSGRTPCTSFCGLCAPSCCGACRSRADPVAERAVAAAKDYIKDKNLKDPKLTILLSSLYNNSFPDFAKKWEELTGVKFEIVPLGYTDIPAKIMQEGWPRPASMTSSTTSPTPRLTPPALRSSFRSTTMPRNTSPTSAASPTA